MRKQRLRRQQFRHLNQSARDRIEALLRAGHRQDEIAVVLSVHKSTISREISLRKRKNGCYKATTAQHKALVKRQGSKYQGMKIEKYSQLRAHIIAELKKHRSPDEIAGRLKRENVVPRVGTNAIYKWLYSVWGQRYCRYLCTKQYRKRRQTRKAKREMIPNRIPLTQRPELGLHAEGDLFVSPIKTRCRKSGVLVCLTNTQLLVGTMIANKKPVQMTQGIRKIISKAPIDDLTLDNGIENRDHERFGVDTYFADPHSPWQKPHIENSIGLLRRWFIPKKTNLRKISEGNLQKCLHILNNKYRKSLGYRSAYEVALENCIIKKYPSQGKISKSQTVAFH